MFNVDFTPPGCGGCEKAEAAAARTTPEMGLQSLELRYAIFDFDFCQRSGSSPRWTRNWQQHRRLLFDIQLNRNFLNWRNRWS